MAPKKLFFILVLAAISAFSFPVLAQDKGAAKPPDNKPPNMTLPTKSPELSTISVKALTGQVATLGAVVSGKKPTMLVFWASWCPDCKAETPAVKAVYDSYAPKGLNVIGISTAGKDTVDMVKAYVQENGLKYPVYYDSIKAAAKAYGITWIPTVILLDKTGKVVYKGPKVSVPAIEALLAGKPIP